jgi:pyruvate,orthophosphate dikinase
MFEQVNYQQVKDLKKALPALLHRVSGRHHDRDSARRDDAEPVAKEAEFFSFGTNDLTQTTMGLSRDDYTKFSKHYEDIKVFKADPFAVLDREGVGRVIEYAVKAGRSTRPDLEIGICGEHGGEPSSVEFCYMIGMDYVSCSPYRVPIARLAAAQAALSSKGDKSETMRTA